MQEAPQGTTKVCIYTDRFIIVGEINMFSDTRLTDYMIGSNDFIAVTNAHVRTLKDRALFSADFLNVQKNKITIIVPETMVKQV